ncbi:MAG: hypothetical protein K0S76_1014 [Herbinix sp.]|jgi:hypothetical protein|nr:hypothetical protein [Herbinix sp.]
MNIIELVKQIISEFPQISALNKGVDVDFNEADSGCCGLYPTGDQLIKEDILGNQDRTHNFVLYAVFDGFNDYQRLANSTFLLDLVYWLEHAANGQSIEVTIDEQIVTGKLTKLSGANGMLYGYQEGTLSGQVTYQLQIYAQYHLESEELL